MNTDLYNSDTKHCLICGSSHDKGTCPPENFALISCECGNSFTMPWDAVMFAQGMQCGQCGCDDKFSTKNN